MAVYKFDTLRDKYDRFRHPVILLKINGSDFADNKYGFTVSDIEVELTSGYEASIATFCLYDTFDTDNGCFLSEEAKSYIMIGSSVDIAMGYSYTAEQVFCGFITKVNFFYDADEIPGIQVTAMDVKGIMMANRYSRQLTAKSYGEAVEEVFNKGPYQSMTTTKLIEKIVVSDTPDKPLPTQVNQTSSAKSIEMVAESDYEFVVKAAKKYNYEFFTECGIVYFRKAKQNAKVLLEIGPGQGLQNLDVEYDITGLVETIRARGTDVGTAKLIESKQKFSNKISMGNRAKKLIKRSEKVYLDATISSMQEADYRVDSLMEEMSYRFGTLDCTCVGMPELLPGNFVELQGVGQPPDNQFYLVKVVHRMNDDCGFETKLYGKASSIEKTIDLAGAAGIGGAIGGLI